MIQSSGEVAENTQKEVGELTYMTWDNSENQPPLEYHKKAMLCETHPVQKYSSSASKLPAVSPSTLIR